MNELSQVPKRNFSLARTGTAGSPKVFQAEKGLKDDVAASP